MPEAFGEAPEVVRGFMRRDAEKAWRNWNPLIWGVIRYRGCSANRQGRAGHGPPRRRSCCRSCSRCTADLLSAPGTRRDAAFSPRRVLPPAGGEAMALTLESGGASGDCGSGAAGTGALRLCTAPAARRPDAAAPPPLRRMPLRPSACTAGRSSCDAQTWPYIDASCTRKVRRDAQGARRDGAARERAAGRPAPRVCTSRRRRIRT